MKILFKNTDVKETDIGKRVIIDVNGDPVFGLLFRKGNGGLFEIKLVTEDGKIVTYLRSKSTIHVIEKLTY